MLPADELRSLTWLGEPGIHEVHSLLILYTG